MGGFFVWNGIGEALNFPATTLIFLHLGLPQPAICAAIASFVETVGGIALTIGYKTRLSAGALAMYVLLITLLRAHAPAPGEVQLILQNLAITGGLMYALAYGNGRWSRD